MKKNDKNTPPDEPKDFQPLGKDYPLEEEVVDDDRPEQKGEPFASYESDDRDSEGRHASERRTGPFEVPENETSGEGWTLPIRKDGGWVHPMEQSLEEKLDQIDEEEK